MSKLTLRLPVPTTDLTEERLRKEREQAVREARRHANKARAYVAASGPARRGGKFFSPITSRTDRRQP